MAIKNFRSSRMRAADQWSNFNMRVLVDERIDGITSPVPVDGEPDIETNYLVWNFSPTRLVSQFLNLFIIALRAKPMRKADFRIILHISI